MDFVKYLRPEIKYSGPEALLMQIRKDIAQAAKILEASMKIAVIGAMREEEINFASAYGKFAEEREIENHLYVGEAFRQNSSSYSPASGRSLGNPLSALIRHPDTQLAINTGVAGGVPGRSNW